MLLKCQMGKNASLHYWEILARRLALANPNKGNPLLGQGIVLIDEVELHMHPSWQEKF